MNKFNEMLLTRGKNGITLCFGRNVVDQPEKITTARSARLSMTVQLGPKPLQEIAGTLHKFGFVGNLDMWLEN